MTPEDLTEDERERWEERSAIMQYDGGLSREAAEAAAMVDVVQRREGRGA